MRWSSSSPQYFFHVMKNFTTHTPSFPVFASLFARKIPLQCLTISHMSRPSAPESKDNYSIIPVKWSNWCKRGRKSSLFCCISTLHQRFSVKAPFVWGAKMKNYTIEQFAFIDHKSVHSGFVPFFWALDQHFHSEDSRRKNSFRTSSSSSWHESCGKHN